MSTKTQGRRLTQGANRARVSCSGELPATVDQTPGRGLGSSRRRALDEHEFLQLVELLAGLDPLEMDAAYVAARHYRQFEEHNPIKQRAANERVPGS